jgi:hypothetical protein
VRITLVACCVSRRWNSAFARTLDSQRILPKPHPSRKDRDGNANGRRCMEGESRGRRCFTNTGNSNTRPTQQKTRSLVDAEMPSPTNTTTSALRYELLAKCSVCTSTGFSCSLHRHLALPRTSTQLQHISIHPTRSIQYRLQQSMANTHRSSASSVDYQSTSSGLAPPTWPRSAAHLHARGYAG